MIPAGLLVTVLSSELLQVTNIFAATSVIPRKRCISMAHVPIIVQFLINTDINGTEISAIILVFMVGISTGMVLASLRAIILLLHHTKMANITAIILAPNTPANTFISTRVA